MKLMVLPRTKQQTLENNIYFLLRNKQQNLALIVYINILLISYLLDGIYYIQQGKYGVCNIIICQLVTLLSYLFGYVIYNFMKKNTYYKQKIYFKVNLNRLNIFFTIYIIIMIIYGSITGDGAAERGNTYSSSILASMWNPNAIFIFYYCLCRDKTKTIARVNALLYIIYQLILGWTGCIITIAMLELYYSYRNRSIDPLKILFVTTFAYIGGGALYAILYPLKFAIRYGTTFSWAEGLTVIEGISKLTGRLSQLGTSLFISNNLNEIVNLYQKQRIQFLEIKSIFRPIIPSSIMHEKIFSNINSCIYNGHSGYIGINISNSCPILYYFKLLFQCDPFCVPIYICVCVICLFLLKKIYNSFQFEPGQFDMLYFWILFYGYSINGSLELLIMQSYIKIIFFIPLLWVLRVIKIRIRKKANN